MTSVSHSLRFKLALTFAVFGALVSTLLSLGLLFSATSLGDRLMDETLHAEIDDFMSRRSRNPNAFLPATASIHGYLLTQGKSRENIPPELSSLKAGIHQLVLNNTPYRVAVLDKNSERYFMLFNETRHNHREKTFIIYLVSGALIMILVSAWVGWWLAGRVVAPIEELARRVFRISAEESAETIAQGFSSDEIGQLAQVFSSYLIRMRAFIDRERNFTSDVSHELRTPLAIVQGVVELMKEDKQLGPKQQERIARIDRVNSEMVNLTKALLLMSREYFDEMVVQACDVGDVVSEVVETNRYLLSEKTSVNYVCRAHSNIKAERTLLSIVVANLIRNAFTHTPSGVVTILVEGNGLTVSDTGTGIPGEEINKVFHKHFKGTESTGSGIGLSLVKRICDRYGWKILIGSAEKQGTSVQLYFGDMPIKNHALTLP